jgi:esterase/lipase
MEQFLFFPNKEIKKTPLDINLEFENININFEENIFHGWYIKGNYKNSMTLDKCILFCHGNAGNISFRLYYIEKLYELGFSLLFFDYPGFGQSTGIPNEELCIKCGQEYYKYLINNKKYLSKNIILYGESIGGSIASSIANIYNIKYLIIQSTFTDIKDVIKLITSLNIVLTNNIGFETLENLKERFKKNIFQKKMKTLVIHSNNDELIDQNHAIELSKYANKLYLCNGTHSNIIMDDDFVFNLLSFIKD